MDPEALPTRRPSRRSRTLRVASIVIFVVAMASLATWVLDGGLEGFGFWLVLLLIAWGGGELIEAWFEGKQPRRDAEDEARRKRRSSS